jgi:outer membrane protein OmpA-like peptidoglycan-associated protein
MNIINILVFVLVELLTVQVYAQADTEQSNVLSEKAYREGLSFKKPLSKGWPGTEKGVIVEKEGTVPTLQVQQINFLYKSSELTTDGQLNLDHFAAVINEEEFKHARFKLTGHTDSIGGEAYNQRLSEQRAESAKVYLVNRHHISEDRLLTEGKGFSEPLQLNDTENAINRRVQITNLGN